MTEPNLSQLDFSRREMLHLLALSTLVAATGCNVISGSREAIAGSPRSVSGSGFVPDVELLLTAAPDEVPVLPGELTRVWRFKGRLVKGPSGTLEATTASYIGPIIHLRRGQKVRIRFSNQLSEASIVHWHGLDVPESADGHPRLAIEPGSEYVSEFEVTNRAGSYWYHPHPDKRTGAQVYQGLAGMLIVHDEEEDALRLPSGDSELLCVLQDRRFDADNQLAFHGTNMMETMNGFLGDRVLVNGLPDSTKRVGAGWIRVRLLNASNARIYKLAWSHDIKMVVIGGDGGLLEQPLTRQILTLAPGQRADVLLDLTGFPPGTKVNLDSKAYLASDASTSMRMGMMGGGPSLPNGAPLRIMTIQTSKQKGTTFKVPARLCIFDATWSVQTTRPIRQISLSFQRMEWLLDGRTFQMEDVAPEDHVVAHSTQIWEFTNVPSQMVQAAHPMHVHGSPFRVLSRTGGNSSNTLRGGIIDAGWRDTVLVLPGETVRIQKTFTRHPGLYLYHCHILEHEDMGMMRNFRVT